MKTRREYGCSRAHADSGARLRGPGWPARSSGRRSRPRFLSVLLAEAEDELGVVRHALSRSGATAYCPGTTRSMVEPDPTLNRSASPVLFQRVRLQPVCRGSASAVSQRRPCAELGQRVAGEPPSSHRREHSRVRRLGRQPTLAAPMRHAEATVLELPPLRQLEPAAALGTDDGRRRHGGHGPDSRAVCCPFRQTPGYNPSSWPRYEERSRNRCARRPGSHDYGAHADADRFSADSVLGSGKRTPPWRRIASVVAMLAGAAVGAVLVLDVSVWAALGLAAGSLALVALAPSAIGRDRLAE